MALCLRGIAAHSPGNYGRNAMSVYRSRNSQETDGNLQSFVFLYRGGVTDFITDPSIDSGRRPRHNQKTKNKDGCLRFLYRLSSLYVRVSDYDDETHDCAKNTGIVLPPGQH